MNHLSVTTATTTRDDALALLRSAVKNRYAASGHIHGPVTTASWHTGAYTEGEAWILLLTTTMERRTDLETHLTTHHPEGPSAPLTITPITGSTPHLTRITDSTSH